MSFGVGFGDIVKAIGLAKQVVTTYRSAPNQVKELADEISGLLGVLEGAYSVLRRRERDLTEYERNTLLSILQGYTAILNKLRTAYNENHTLATDASHDAIKDHRQEITHYNAMLSSFMGLLNTPVVLETHRKVETLVEYKSAQEDQQLLAWLSLLDFGKQHTDRLQDASKLNVFATLRPIQELLSGFEESGITLHVLEIRAHQDDIHKFVDHKIMDNLRFLKRRPQEEREKIQLEIKSSIGQAADGMFLLVSLYLDSITRCRNVNSIRKAITELPKGPNAYDKLYANTMTRIQSRDTRDLAMHVLSWVAWAKRHLTVRELQHALAIIDGAETLDEDSITDAEDLISSCEGLLILDPNTNIISLAHYTIQEYLETIRDTWFSDVENDMLRVCLEILSSPNFENGRCRRDTEFEKRLRDYPLYDYACRHWGDHAINSTEMDEALFTFLKDVPKTDAASQCQLSYRGHCRIVSTGVTGLHLAALYGLDEVASRLISNGHGANQRESYGRSPLFWAVAGGVQSMVATLLRHDAEVDSQDNIGRTALFVAAEHGQLEIVKTLVNHGASADLTDYFGRSPIIDASEAGHETVVSYLLQHCPDVQADQAEKSGRSALWRAAFKGHWGVVRLLVAHGADIDTILEDGQTLISLAVQQGNRDATECLITMGANVNLVDPESRTPLFYTAGGGFSSIAAILIDHGADPSLADEDGWTPLMWSCESGKLDVVSMLLKDKHPDILGHTDRFGQTALSIASRTGRPDIVKVLLERDSEWTTINLPEESGWTPLIQAAKHGSREVIGMLLNANGNATARDCAGKTALHWAADYGNVAAALSLLDAGALVDATDIAMRTPLWYATRNGHVDVVEALLNAHAAVDVADSLERTPLQLAIENGHDRIAEILLDNKAELGALTVTGWAFLHVPSLTASVREWGCDEERE
ncbi:hypothetical protein CEP54_014487 [Fusarium duplospermum]|uniref:GPI inositol-deacylase winged helix domain-containing protein n=1 Tax=Fusarium duplospermum TaxID=1325734 RepID=A0A428NW18_9HYPO|nr:hypothetical protein CEP54_014487 [Fusarium duplospermum]